MFAFSCLRPKSAEKKQEHAFFNMPMHSSTAQLCGLIFACKENLFGVQDLILLVNSQGIKHHYQTIA